MNTIRKTIAERLNYEFSRRNLNTGQVAKLCNLDESIVESYLVGSRAIDINEIKSICSKFNINSTRLLFSKHYPNVNLSFRNSASNVQNFAASIENVFLLLKNSLNRVSIDFNKQKSTDSNAKNDLITEAASHATSIKQDYPNPIDFLKNYSIPVLPVKGMSLDFDAFLLRDEENMLICINSSKPHKRILFSLAHEISHIIFDPFIDNPIDTFIPNFYWKKWLANHEVNEFFAYKFAEFYLLPFDSVYPIVKRWPSLDLKLAQDLLNKSYTTRDVLANAILDVLLVTNNFTSGDDETEYSSQTKQFQRMDWEEGYDNMPKDTSDNESIDFPRISKELSSLKNSPSPKYVEEFISDSQSSFQRVIMSERQNLSDEIFNYIMEIIGVGEKN